MTTLDIVQSEGRAVQTVISSVIIFLGAAVMLGSILKSRDLLKAAPFILERRRGPILRLLKIHTALMAFFIVGYVVVALAFLLDLQLVGKFFVSAVFFFGATFVFLGILIQSRMLLEIQSTVHGILPLCSKCNKIRLPDADPKERKSWIAIGAYVSQKTGAGFSQGFCPDCMDELYGVPEEQRS